ncbi:helix-turn-helix domain-containing protein [Opitutales bacterium]|nr:helix-turn-helix domain-containing protein [Opitutales bacterium]
MQSEDLGSLVGFHRKKANLTQIQLAELAGVSRFIVQEIEAGKGRTTWKHLEAVLEALNLRLEPRGPLVDEWIKSKEAAR